MDFKTIKLISATVCLLGSISPVMAHNSARGVQNSLSGAFSMPVAMPADGSNCDPSVIKGNLKKLSDSGTFEATNLTLTVPAQGMCYGPCQPELDAALDVHCAKAEKLAEMVELL